MKLRRLEWRGAFVLELIIIASGSSRGKGDFGSTVNHLTTLFLSRPNIWLSVFCPLGRRYGSERTDDDDDDGLLKKTRAQADDNEDHGGSGVDRGRTGF